MRPKYVRWISIGAIVFSTAFLVRTKPAEAMFGEEIPFLVQLIAHAVTQIKELSTIIGAAQDTASVLDEMNRGVKEVLRLSETAHVPLPPQVYAQADAISLATATAHGLYGALPDSAPGYIKTHYQSGIEGLYFSQDAFDYATFLDQQGKKIKESAVSANQTSATKLTAESMGVLVQGVDQTNRLQAKNLEIASSQRIEVSAKESAKLDSYVETHNAIERDLNDAGFSPLSSFDPARSDGPK